MLSWASGQLEKISQAVAPPPTDAVSRYLYCVQQQDEDAAMGCLAEFDPLSTVIQPTKGTLSIHLACQHGMIRLIRRLMAIPGANIQAVDMMGNTPLHYACMSSSTGTAVDVARMLVGEYKASVVAKNAQGQTPYDVASLNGIRQYLLPLQLQQETQQALDNGGVGLPPGIDMGGLRINKSAVPPPPIGGMSMNGTPPPVPGSTGSAAPGAPTPPGPGQMFTTPSPSQVHHRSQSMPPEHHARPPVASAPKSGDRTASDSTYAMHGHSSAAILSSSRFRPDGFHSSSSDVGLQRKYGHVDTPPSSATHVPPPPSSGNSSTGPPSGGSGGSNPFAAGASAVGRYGRYPVYNASTGGTSTIQAPHSAGYAYGGAAAVPSYAVFTPSASQATAQPQQQAQPGFPPAAPSPTAAPVQPGFAPSAQQQAQPQGFAPSAQQQAQLQHGFASSAPSSSTSNPTSPYLPPPPYQGQAPQQQQPMMQTQSQFQQPAHHQPQQTQQYPSQPASTTSPTYPTPPTAAQGTACAPRQSPPAIPSRDAMAPTTSTGSMASAEELFASPSPMQTAHKAETSSAATESADAATNGTSSKVGEETTSNANAEDLFGAPPPKATEFSGVPKEEAASSVNVESKPEDVTQPSLADKRVPLTKSERATDVFGPSPSGETETPSNDVDATRESSNRVDATSKSETPVSETAGDLDEMPLEDVALSPADKESGNGSAPHATSQAGQPGAGMPPPPFSSSR